jgi:tetratricopeptide (TPR) repeat protein
MRRVGPPVKTSLAACIVLWSTGSLAQNKPAVLPPKPAEKSHQERFASPAEAARRNEERLTRRIQTHPADARAWMERGVVWMRSGDLAAAQADLRHAVRLAPANADAHANLALLYFVKNQLDDARRETAAAFKLDARHAGANLTYAQIIEKQGGDIHDAISHLETAANRDPENIEIQYELFAAYRAAHDVEHASAQLRLMKMSLPPENPGVYYWTGLLQTDLGNLPAAVAQFRKALAGNPQSERIRQDLGVALVQTGSWEEAAEVLAPLASVQPDSYMAAYFHGLALSNIGNAKDAEAEVERAARLNPKSVDAFVLLGIIRSGRGDQAGALQAIQQALAVDPASADANLYLGKVKYGMNDVPAAIEAFRASLASDPESTEARFLLATVLEVAGEKDDAVSEYQELLRRHPQDVRGYLGLGAIEEKYGQSEQALGHLRKAHELDPKGYEPCLALGKLVAKGTTAEEGIALLRDAVAAAPEKPEAHFQLGMALRRAGRNAEAQQEFERVEELNKEHRNAGQDH